MIIYIDIDETICYTSKNRDYRFATPITERIEKINKLYDEGNYIVYWTARGSVTKIDWRDLTIEQLKKWNAKYSELRMDKPYYDLFIDDKNINSDEFFSENKNE